MNGSNDRYGLISSNDQVMPLKGTHIEATLQDLLSEVCVTQTFQNDESQSVEAVYTFPLPLDAVLLNFSVTLDEKVLIGVVQERKEAEERYEEAISEGDSGIMLQQLEPGFYSVNVGNLAHNETAVIRFQYTQLHRWTQDVLRWHVPTVLAPRYGHSGLAPHQLPEIDLTVQHLFALKVEIKGLLRNAIIESPSHVIELQHREDATNVHLMEGRSFLDRDLILNLRFAGNKVCAISDLDIDGYVALASFYPSAIKDKSKADKPKLIKLLIDCSGSMSGDSIGQARAALLNILDSLHENDRFLLVRFGSEVVVETQTLLQATPANIAIGRTIVARIEADLGGTEIFSALAQTINLTSNDEPVDMLLITDGEVWDNEEDHSKTQEIVELANASHHRIFTVGVGSAVSERFVREIADGTQAACELVNPNEGMAEKIERHFKRIYAEPAKSIIVDWPTNTIWETTPRYFFAGDTVHVFASFQQKPEGIVKLSAIFEDQNNYMEQEVGIKSVGSDERMNPLSRIAAHQQLSTLNGEDKIALAVKYQLLCTETAYLMVQVRPEELKTDGMPELRKVPQMLAAGWGGTGTSSLLDDYAAFCPMSKDSDEMYDVDMSESAEFEPFEIEPSEYAEYTECSKNESLGLVLRNEETIDIDNEWIRLPFPDNVRDDELELFVNDKRVFVTKNMAIKRTSQIKIIIISDLCHVLSYFNELTPVVKIEIQHPTDDSIANIAHLLKLKKLILTECQDVTDDGLAPLVKLKALKLISINNGPKLTDKLFQFITNLSGLEQLQINYCVNITENGLYKLKSLLYLNTVYISYCSSVGEQWLLDINDWPRLIDARFIDYCNKIYDSTDRLSACLLDAENDHVNAQFILGLMYRYGIGGDKDYSKAFFWLNKASDNGHAIAQFRLGFLYAQGLGVVQDYSKAVTLCIQAAENGCAEAQVNLGDMYANGRHVEKDLKQARFWFKNAVEQGYTAAQDYIDNLEIE
ncbi:MAG: VIT domain-containing protein [Methylomonas lenta]|nr:VIT domain-containing protein [Methylomonas lenta]